MRPGSIAILAACLASASVIPEFSLNDLVGHSERIVHGRVIRHWTAWDPSHHFVWTHYAIRTTATLKGETASDLVVSEPGGTLDGITMSIADVPRHEDGEELVLFLHRTPIRYWRTFGYAQGRFKVERSASAVPLLRSPAARHPYLRVTNGMPLDQFEAKIRSLVRETANAR